MRWWHWVAIAVLVLDWFATMTKVGESIKVSRVSAIETTIWCAFICAVIWYSAK